MCYSRFVVFICVQWCPTYIDYMRKMLYQRQELLALRGRLGSPLIVGGVHVAHLFSFLCCVCILFQLVFVLRTQCCPFLCIVLIAPVIFSNDYSNVLEINLELKVALKLKFNLRLVQTSPGVPERITSLKLHRQ